MDEGSPKEGSLRDLRNNFGRHGRVRLAAFAAAAVMFAWAEAPAHAASEQQFLIVEGAEDVREHHFDATYWQISYTLDTEFPWLAVDEPQWQQLQASGWSKCEGRSSGWDSYTDASRNPNRIVHQNFSDWIKGNRMITVLLRYDSAVRGDSRDAVPDNTTQRVFLLFDEDVKGHNSIAWLDLRCP
jgi:hypothetical protein